MDSRIFYICGVLIALAVALACCSAGIEPRVFAGGGSGGAWAAGPSAGKSETILRASSNPVASLVIKARFAEGAANPFLVDSDDGTVLINLQAELAGVEFSTEAASGQLALSLASAHEVVSPVSTCDLAVSIDGLADGERAYLGLYGEDAGRSKACRDLISRARERGLRLRYHDVPLADDSATVVTTVDLMISAD